MELEEILSENYIKLEEVFNSVVEGVIIANPQRNFLYWNEAARKMLGIVSEDTDPNKFAENFKLFDAKTGFYLTDSERPMVMALNGQEFYGYRVMIKNTMHPEGTLFSVNGKPIKSGLATVAGITTFREITEEVKLENKITRERNFYERILDLMPGIVFIKSIDGKYIYGNKGFNELLHTTSVIGKTTNDFLIKEMAEEIIAHDKLVLSSGVAHHFDEVIYWKDGSKSVFRTTRFPYATSEGNTIGICAVARDVTREIESEAIIEEERERSVRISKQATIGILSAEIAHEFRNPLTILQTSIDVVKSALHDPEIDRNLITQKLEVMNGTIARMSKVASSLGVLSRESTDDEFSSFPVRDILEDVKSLTSFRTKSLNMEVVIDESKCLNELLTANRVQLSEVLLNLCVNAIDAVEKLPRPMVHISCEKVKNSIEIRIFDNGPGVPDALLAKIFEPFFTTKDVLKGTGLGLSISKKIIDRHQGAMFYESRNDVHSFVVRIPQQPHY